MRKLLQNKAVVAGLAVVAGACIAGNFVQWPARKGAIPVAARVAPETPAVDAAAFPIRSPLRIAGTLAAWMHSTNAPASSRDPFKPAYLPTPRSNPVLVTTAPATPPSFVVQAISVEGEKILAVVNRRVVAAGDQIEGYLVERIQANQVHLRGPTGPVTVSIRDPRRPVPAPVPVPKPSPK